MKTQSICLAFAIALLCAAASAQWVRTGGPDGGLQCLAASGTNLFAGGWGVGVFRSTNNGTSWTAVNAGLMDTAVMSLFVSGTNLFAGTWSGGVFHSSDNGSNWTPAGLTGNAVQAFAVSGANLFAATGGWCCGGVFLSTNNGTDWAPVNNGLPPNIRFRAIVLSGTSLFAGAIEGGVGVFLSTNNGTSWTPASAGLTDNEVSAFVVSGTNLFVGTYMRGIFLSTNNGTTWTSASEGLPRDAGGYVVPIYCFASDGQNLFAGTYDGPFLSTNNGTSWSAVNTGLTETIVYCLAVSGTNLFAGTQAGGVWRRPLSEMITTVENPDEKLTYLVLEQNYPNPFNPATNIQFSIVNRQLTIVKVLDVLGREVATLVNEVKEPRTYTLQFDASNLSSGVYFCRLTAGDYVMTIRMLVLK